MSDYNECFLFFNGKKHIDETKGWLEKQHSAIDVRIHSCNAGEFLTFTSINTHCPVGFEEFTKQFNDCSFELMSFNHLIGSQSFSVYMGNIHMTELNYSPPIGG